MIDPLDALKHLASNAYPRTYRAQFKAAADEIESLRAQLAELKAERVRIAANNELISKEVSAIRAIVERN